MSATDLAGAVVDADLERRFGGLRRLYGTTGYATLRAGRVAVVGLGGVGSWAAEALARSGVAQLVLIDLDHVSESNINRQVQATTASIGAHKGQALAARVAQIHPGCDVQVVDEFVTDANWPGLWPAPLDVLIDACDQVRAKVALASWALASGTALVCVGAAGGKRLPQAVVVEDLADATHDPLLASMRQRLRKSGAWDSGAARRSGLRCVFSREAVTPPVAEATGEVEPVSAASDGGLNCHGYGSSVTVTATFGMVAAAEAIARLLRP